MNQKCKVMFFGENDLNNFNYCIDQTIYNNKVREELSKKIHSLQGVLIFPNKGNVY